MNKNFIIQVCSDTLAEIEQDLARLNDSKKNKQDIRIRQMQIKPLRVKTQIDKLGEDFRNNNVLKLERRPDL
ncbi:MAG: hypothetical protein SOW44_01395 [Porphyromonas sp.]|nr:hypothetical protein [Bacteroidales bacterium]MDY3099988.1 hypothetical protein [Porphyromonas sp.]